MEKQKTQKTVPFWYQIYQKIGPVFIFRAIALTGIMFGYTALFSLINPNIGEAFAYNLTLTTGLLNLGFAVLVALCGIVVAVFFSTLILGWAYKHVKKEIGRTNGGTQYALPDGLGGDILYVEDLDVPNDVNAERVRHYQKVLRDGCYLALLSFRNPFIAFAEGGTGESWAVSRSDFDTEKDLDYAQESTSDFQTFAQGFRRAFSVYCAQRKIERGANVMDTVSNSMFGSRVAATCFALAFSLLTTSAAFAQNNTQRIVQALGASAQYVPKDGAKVTYTWTNGASATRTADGVTNVAELYAKGRAGLDGKVNGDVLGVDIEGLQIAVKAVNKRTDNDQPANTKEAKPLFKTALKAANEAAPDSTTFADAVNEMEGEVEQNGGAMIHQLQKVVTGKLFGWLTNGIIILFLLFRFLSNTAKEEGRINVYGHTIYGGWAVKVGDFLGFFAWVFGVIMFIPILTVFAWHMLEFEIMSAIYILISPKNIVFIILAIIFSVFERVIDWLLKNQKVKRSDNPNNGGGRGNFPAPPR